MSVSSKLTMSKSVTALMSVNMSTTINVSMSKYAC